MIIQGKKMKEVALASPSTYVKFYKGLHAFKSIIMEPRNEVPEVTVIVGSTGSGKTRRAREMLTDYWMWNPQMNQWFDMYEGQKHVIFDEFRGQFPLGMTLSLLDRYECKVQYKGGCMEFVANKIVITSPKHPSEWYESIGSDKIDQLMRRITEIICLD